MKSISITALSMMLVAAVACAHQVTTTDLQDKTINRTTAADESGVLTIKRSYFADNKRSTMFATASYPLSGHIDDKKDLPRIGAEGPVIVQAGGCEPDISVLQYNPAYPRQREYWKVLFKIHVRQYFDEDGQTSSGSCFSRPLMKLDFASVSFPDNNRVVGAQNVKVDSANGALSFDVRVASGGGREVTQHFVLVPIGTLP